MRPKRQINTLADLMVAIGVAAVAAIVMYVQLG